MSDRSAAFLRTLEHGIALLLCMYMGALPWSTEWTCKTIAMRHPADPLLALLVVLWALWAFACERKSAGKAAFSPSSTSIQRQGNAPKGSLYRPAKISRHHALPFPKSSLLLLLRLAWLWICAAFSTLPLVSFKYAFMETLQAGGLFLIAATLPRHWYRGMLFFLASLSGVVLYTLMHHAAHHLRADQALLAPMPFFPEHTQYAAVLCLALPWMWSADMSRLLRRGGTVLLVTALLLSTCRAAWAALLPAALLTRLLYALPAPGAHPRPWCAGGALLLFVLLLFGSLWGFGLSEKMRHDVSWAERLNRYDCAWQMASVRPLTGFGPGTFQFQYLPFQRTEKMTRISTLTPVQERTPHTYGRGGGAHSEYLQAAAETGWPGFVLWCGVVVFLLYSVWALPPASVAPFRRMPALAFWGLLTFFVHALVNNFLHEGIVATLIWGQAGYLLSNNHQIGRNLRGL